MKDNEKIEFDDGVDDGMSEERREFIKKLGKYAAVTPPAVAGLMTGSKSAASNGQNQDWTAWCEGKSSSNPNYADRCL